MHYRALIGTTASAVFASVAAANDAFYPHPGMGMGGMMRHQPPHHCSNAGFMNNNQAGFNTNRFCPRRHHPLTFADTVPVRPQHPRSASHDVFGNIKQKPSVIQVQDGPKKTHPHCHDDHHHHHHHDHNQREYPVVANYKNDYRNDYKNEYKNDYHPEYHNRYYTQHQKPRQSRPSQHGYDGCFGPKEDREYRDFLSRSDHPCKCCGCRY